VRRVRRRQLRRRHVFWRSEFVPHNEAARRRFVRPPAHALSLPVASRLRAGDLLVRRWPLGVLVRGHWVRRRWMTPRSWLAEARLPPGQAGTPVLSIMLSTLLSFRGRSRVTSWTCAKRLAAVFLDVSVQMRFAGNGL
jgi:hypothetical protein